METLEHFLLNGLTMAVGIVFIWVSSLYETQERAVQSSLEDFWLKLAEMKDTFIKSHLGLLKGIALTTNRWVGLVFGTEVWSHQNICSTCCLACLSLMPGVLFLALPRIPVFVNPVLFFWYVQLLCWILCFAALLLSPAFPSTDRTRHWIRIMSIVASCAFFFTFNPSDIKLSHIRSILTSDIN